MKLKFKPNSIKGIIFCQYKNNKAKCITWNPEKDGYDYIQRLKEE